MGADARHPAGPTPDGSQSKVDRNEPKDGGDDEARGQRPADLHRCLVESPAADEAEGWRHTQHGQHSKEEAEGSYWVARSQASVFAVQHAVGLGTAEADKEQRLGQCVSRGGYQSAFKSDEVKEYR